MRKPYRTFAAAMLCIAGSTATFGANPYLPLWEYIPDGEPYVFEDPDSPGKYRVYVYGSHDTLEKHYCGLEQVVWSAPVDDLNAWRYGGVIFEAACDRDGNPLNPDGKADLLYAPDVALVTAADGTKTYYLFPNDQHGRRTLADGSVIFTAHPNGNTHGSLCLIAGRWYVFYHRQCGLDEFSRQAMVAPVTVEVEEGPGGKVVISEAEYTSEGFETDGLTPTKVYPAGIACHYTGTKPAQHNFPDKTFYGSYVEPRRYYGAPEMAAPEIDLTINPVVNNMDGSVVGYKYYNFDLCDTSPAELVLNMLTRGVDATIEIVVGDIYDPQAAIVAGSISIAAADGVGVVTKTAPLRCIAGVKGKQPLYLKFSSPVAETPLADLFWLKMQ